MGSSSCGARALLPCGVWDLPRTGIEPCPLPWQADSEPLDHQGSLQPLLLWQVTLCALVLSSVKWEDNNFWYRAVMNIQFSSVTQSCPTLCNPWTAARQASLSITNYRSLLKLMSIESVIPSNHRFLCRPLLLSPSIFPRIRVFSNESTLCIRWPKNWSFSFSIIPSKEIPGLISFRMDWLDLLVVQGTLKSLLQPFPVSGLR